MYSLNEIKEVLNKYNFDFKKKYGQNFLIDGNIIKKIVNKSNITDETLVIEIGPGSGALTLELSNIAKQVVCYEIDESLKSILDTVLERRNNVDIIYGDFLKQDVKNHLKKYNYKQLYVVANLPYYITTPIITKIVEDELDVDKIVIMVQKEVGNRLKASPGSKDYSSLSVYLNYYFDVKKLVDVSKNVFLPKPNVDSIVVELKKKEKKLEIKDTKLFFQLIRDAFKQKRKTLKNNLGNYDLFKIEEVLRQYEFNLSVRAEQLSLEIFVNIANHL